MQNISDIDLLQSPALRKAFPGIGDAFDMPAVHLYLQQALIGENHGHYTISTTEMEEATYIPGECCVLRYQIGIQDRTTDLISHFTVSGRVFPDAAASGTYFRRRLLPLVPLVAGRQEVAPFLSPAALIEPLRMAVYAFPLDGELPALAAATDPRKVAVILNQTLPPSLRPAWAIDNCRVE